MTPGPALEFRPPGASNSRPGSGSGPPSSKPLGGGAGLGVGRSSGEHALASSAPPAILSGTSSRPTSASGEGVRNGSGDGGGSGMRGTATVESGGYGMKTAAASSSAAAPPPQDDPVIDSDEDAGPRGGGVIDLFAAPSLTTARYKVDDDFD